MKKDSLFSLICVIVAVIICLDVAVLKADISTLLLDQTTLKHTVADYNLTDDFAIIDAVSDGVKMINVIVVFILLFAYKTQRLTLLFLVLLVLFMLFTVAVNHSATLLVHQTYSAL